MNKPLQRLAAAAVSSLLCAAPAAMAADVYLSFSVAGVTRNTCAGLLQPVCTTTAAAGFTETFVLPQQPLSSSGAGVGTFLQSMSLFDFPVVYSSNPYALTLSSLVTMAPDSITALTQLDNGIDTAAPPGLASSFMLYDKSVDAIDAVGGRRTQQQYKLSYDLSALFGSAAAYTDLTSSGSLDYFSKFTGSLSGAFDTLGTASVFNAATGLYDSYAFTEYTGTATLSAVSLVPEPAQWALFGAGVSLLLAARRRLRGAASAAVAAG